MNHREIDLKGFNMSSYGVIWPYFCLFGVQLVVIRRYVSLFAIFLIKQGPYYCEGKESDEMVGRKANSHWCGFTIGDATAWMSFARALEH